VIPFKYLVATKFTDGLAAVKTNNGWGYINTKDEFVIEVQFSDAKQFGNGLAAVEKDDKYGFIDKTGATIIPFEYDMANKFEEGYCDVKKGKWGIIDLSGKAITEFKYDRCRRFINGIAVVYNYSPWEYNAVDKTGKEILPKWYDDLQSFDKKGYAKAKLDNKELWVDKEGKEYDAYPGE